MKLPSTAGPTTRAGTSNGFTLIELMVVLIIIAVFAAIAAPTLVEVHRRNKLTDLLNLVERAAAETRGLAMQTRRGAVLEFDEGQMWINTLSGSTCWSPIQTRCVQNLGQQATDTQTRYTNLHEEQFTEAGAYLCGVEAATLSGESCALDVALTPGERFALCYSGKGDLYLRQGGDDTAACAGTGNPAAVQDDWVRTCVINPASGVPFNGAVLYFNRFEAQPSNCTAPALDVSRGVHLPAGAAPYSRVEI